MFIRLNEIGDGGRARYLNLIAIQGFYSDQDGDTRTLCVRESTDAIVAMIEAIQRPFMPRSDVI